MIHNLLYNNDPNMNLLHYFLSKIVKPRKECVNTLDE